ncbi:unnamed protein product [Heligmosomoides polygyrus]|uniref:40S ribosomal protein S6 n=1 Tax=Heligmosomoides polygyrus TaxID=6339 RepID=A0A3P7XAV5_HELPZ|nr:unnamed protein product [Heligmosomoides polygyrus]
MEECRTDEDVDGLSAELKGFHFASRFGTPKVSSGVKAIMEAYCAKMRAMPASEREQYEKPYKEALLWSLKRPQVSHLSEAGTDPLEHREEPRRRSECLYGSRFLMASLAPRVADVFGTSAARHARLPMCSARVRLAMHGCRAVRLLKRWSVLKRVTECVEHACEGIGGGLKSVCFIDEFLTSQCREIRFQVTMEDRELSATPPPSRQRRTSAGKNFCINKEQVPKPPTSKKQGCSKQQAAAAGSNITKAKRGRKPKPNFQFTKVYVLTRMLDMISVVQQQCRKTVGEGEEEADPGEVAGPHTGPVRQSPVFSPRAAAAAVAAPAADHRQPPAPPATAAAVASATTILWTK